MKFLWLDLETTGLDPEKEEILEVAACVAPFENPLDVNPYTSMHLQAVLPWDKPLSELHPVVAKMHTENGLLEECKRSTVKLDQVEARLLTMIDLTTDRDEQTTLAGSVVSFDLAFIRRWMPTLAKYLHYRVLDVSSIALYCRSLGMPRPPKVEAHRAAADVRESINTLRLCTEYLRPKFLPDPGRRHDPGPGPFGIL